MLVELTSGEVHRKFLNGSRMYTQLTPPRTKPNSCSSTSTNSTRPLPKICYVTFWNLPRATSPIDQADEDLIMAYRKSVLFNNGKVWMKKNKDFDVTMGAQDGAEIGEFTRIYLLKEVDEYLSSLGEKSHAGLYRDDGFIYLENANGSLISKIEKALHRILSDASSKSVVYISGWITHLDMRFKITKNIN